MEQESIELARNLIRAILKARKLCRIYPANNSICINAFSEAYSLISGFLEAHGDLAFRIRPAEILIDSDSVYQNSEKIDNLALWFFKEGVRELTFKTGLLRPEFEDFIRLTGIDFDKEEVSEDFISASWEKSFEHIKFTVDDLSLLDIEGTHGKALEGSATAGNGLETQTGPGLSVAFPIGGGPQEDVTADEAAAEDSKMTEDDGKLLVAYTDGLKREEVTLVKSEELTSEEMGLVVTEMQKDPTAKIDKLVEILLIIFKKSASRPDAAKAARSLQDIAGYSLKAGNLATTLSVLRGIKNILSETAVTPEIREFSGNILGFCGSAEAMDRIGTILDSATEIEEAELSEYAWHLGKDSIGALMDMLEHLQTIRARRMVNNVLIHIGKENTKALVAKLSDPTWFVVRNIVYVLRNIGDAAVLDEILKVAHHEHPRVRLEVMKALNDFRSLKALQAVGGYLEDSDSTVRLTAITVLGNLARESTGSRRFARDAICQKIMDKNFGERDFREKKAFCEALAFANDPDIENYMLKLLKKKSLFGGRKNSELRACAAYYLGLVKSREAFYILEGLGNSGDTLLREHAADALRRIKNA